MNTKLSRLTAAFQAGNNHEALRIAARFPQLGEHKEAITRAWAAIQHPGFYRQIGQSPDDLIASGINAIRARYSL